MYGGLTASLISSRWSSVSRLKGLESGAGPCCAAGGADCCTLGPASAALKSPVAVVPRPRWREKDDALKGIAFALTDRSGSL